MFERYKIIAIEDEQTILIDYGMSDGAREGDSLRIIEPGNDLVINGVSYGTYDGIKEIVEVVTPYESFSACQRIIKRTTSILSPVTALQRTIARSTPLNVEKSEISDSVAPPIVTPIRVGDTAVLTKE